MCVHTVLHRDNNNVQCVVFGKLGWFAEVPQYIYCANFTQYIHTHTLRSAEVLVSVFRCIYNTG